MYGIWRVRQPTIDDAAISMGAAVLRRGGTVAFPTETVYGLGANALDPLAVTGIFHAKERPLSDPLIVHLSHRRQLSLIARDIPPLAWRLAEAFWPGPLTLILKKSKAVPMEVTSGGDTVGVRIPHHPIARALIRASGVPVAAPSANRFTRPSATTARHVADDLLGRVDAILDGGGCGVGIESTIVRIDGDVAHILRPGGISREALEAFARRVEYGGFQVSEGKKPVVAPGQMLKHYAPNGEFVVVDGPEAESFTWMCERAEAAADQGRRVGLIVTETQAKLVSDDRFYVVGLGDGADSVEQLAHTLYSALRQMEAVGVDVIFTRMPEPQGLGLGLRDRLFRAAVGRVHQLGGTERGKERDE